MSRDTGRFTVLHLSDVHATESGLLYDAVDGLGRLERVGDYARSAGMTPEAVVVTGDLVQRGNPAAYPAVAEACRRLEEAVGAPVLTVLGNHDDPEAARALPDHRERHFGERTIDGFRIVRLDSHAGGLDAEQLDWLAAVLSAPSERGTILALHHAPIGSPMPALRRQGLAAPDALLGILDGSDTRAILAGHFHHALTASVRGIPVFVAPSLAYHQVMDAGPHAVAGHDSPMFSLVQFTHDGVSSSAIALHTPEPLFTHPITRTPEKANHVS
ncbi:metallophosphoesterase family protein [Leucobacter sp.]